MAKRSRRRMLADLVTGAAAAAAAPVMAAATRPTSITAPCPTLLPSAPVRQVVHYVSESRRCLLATVIDEKDGVLHVEYEQRPPTIGPGGVIHYYQRIWLSNQHPVMDGKAAPKVGTWHEAEGCPCGRAYAQWIYGRHRKSDEEALAHLSEEPAPVCDLLFGVKEEGRLPWIITAPTPAEIERARVPDD